MHNLVVGFALCPTLQLTNQALSIDETVHPIHAETSLKYVHKVDVCLTDFVYNVPTPLALVYAETPSPYDTRKQASRLRLVCGE